MFGKPNYCCNCGDKVERLEWHVWNSRRFCELCETEFQFDEWWPRGAVFLIFIVGITGIGFNYGDPVRPNVPEFGTIPVRQKSGVLSVGESGVPSPKVAPPVESTAVAPEAKTSPTPSAGRKASPVAPAPVAKETSVEDEEVFYCGALTKKGTPCSRRVKKGERCWQHKASEQQSTEANK